MTLFKPGAAYRIRRSNYTDTPLPDRRAAWARTRLTAQSSTTSLPDFHQRAPSPWRSSIAGGKLVRKYASTDAPFATQDELVKAAHPALLDQDAEGASRDTGDTSLDMGPAVRQRLHATNGMSILSRLSRTETPRVPQGPLVLPGNLYTVRLTADGKVLTAPLTVKMDPRVKATPA